MVRRSRRGAGWFGDRWRDVKSGGRKVIDLARPHVGKLIKAQLPGLIDKAAAYAGGRSGHPNAVGALRGLVKSNTGYGIRRRRRHAGSVRMGRHTLVPHGVLHRRTHRSLLPPPTKIENSIQSGHIGQVTQAGMYARHPNVYVSDARDRQRSSYIPMLDGDA